jgi:hypothetical protein
VSRAMQSSTTWLTGGATGLKCCAMWALLACIGLPAEQVHAHPGGLNAEGCHNNRKTGDYHCHGGASRPVPARAQSLLSRSGGDTYYPNCAAARAAGAAPVRRGQPGYRPGLDRDGDGVGCE